MYYAPFVPQERVIIAHSLVKEGHQKVRGWTEDAEIVFSDDLFKTKSVVLDRGNKFLVTSNFFFAVQVDDEDIQNVKLYVGNPYRSDLSKLSPIALPGRKQQKKKKDSKLLEHSYTILDTSEEQVFLHINHEGERSKFGNIYISDSTGQRFALSVRNNVRNANGQCDFEKVVGLEGIFLANVYDAKIVEKMKGEFEGDQAISTSQTKAKSNVKATPSTKTADAEGEKGKRLRELDEFKMTLISFDKGGVWKPLTPPKADSKGEAIDCELEEGCSRHLHSFTSSKYGPFYSTESSRGIVIGVGNVGKYLSNKEDEVNTYLSRDGGFSWFEVMKGSHIFEISDHGALIVIAPDQTATTTVYYTWNEGLTWESLQISSTPIHISNIVTELSNIGQHFVVYGRTATSAKEHYRDSKGVIVSLDFGSLHERVCQLPDKPDNPASDYEKWSPNGLISAHCLMGRQTTYIRRKREAECYNPETAEGWVTVKKCECTEEDWECDLGFERKKDGSCEATSIDTISYDPPEDCDGYYYVSQGYRKVAGDSCEGE